MNHSAALHLAITLMNKHNLLVSGWSFKFDNAKRRFGVCSHRKMTISLSRHLVGLNDKEQVEDTILHEIAHALVGPGHGHDAVWKAKCVEIGAKPERCYNDDDVTVPTAKYKAICDGCGRTHKVHRLRKGRRYACICQNHLPWDKKKILNYIEQY